MKCNSFFRLPHLKKWYEDNWKRQERITEFKDVRERKRSNNLIGRTPKHDFLNLRSVLVSSAGFEMESNRVYILIRYPPQTSSLKQATSIGVCQHKPCATLFIMPSSTKWMEIIQQTEWKLGNVKNYSKKNNPTKWSKLCSYNNDSVNIQNVLNLSYSSMQKTTSKRNPWSLGI